MRHLIFEKAERYPVALLVKTTAFKQHELLNNYVQPLKTRGIKTKELIAFTLAVDDNNKLPVGFAKKYLDQLLPVLDSCGVQILYVTDSVYFKLLTKQSKAEPHYGYVLPCKYPGYEHLNVVLGLNYQTLIYNPDLKTRMDLTLDTLVSYIQNTYVALGSGIIQSEQYPRDPKSIAEALSKLHQYETLTCDIEAFSLRFNEAGIATISFAWDEHNGVAFPVDYVDVIEPSEKKLYGHQGENHEIRNLIKEFLISYRGTIIWHNATYDLKVLIYTLWMKNLLDTAGLLEGLEVMTRSFHDSKIIAYLATNSTAGNVLGLKALAHEFAGNWANDSIHDVRCIPLPELLRYNLIDALCTRYVFNKYLPVMQEDKQEELYNNLMLPSLKLIIQIELSGMPMDQKQVSDTKEFLLSQSNEHLDVIRNSSIIQTLNQKLQHDEMVKANAKLKVKQHPLSKFAGVTFNPNSGVQLQKLLYDQLRLPVIDYTDTKMPATGADTLEKLIHHTNDPEQRKVLEAIIAYGKISKILSTFIPAFERGILKDDGRLYLHGSFNLGGTVSGRLSSSDPKFWALN